ncbi:MAG: 50S ribosomal protein L25/general stress protein Ctc [Gammaproteobacteria bacterium]|jgi:large subunit ribosomal protein L25
MAVEFQLDAELRTDMGKGASRRLRRAGKVPGILYGGKKGPAALSFPHKDVVKSLEHEAFYSHILTVSVDGKAERAVLKDLQRHPFKPVIMHLDLQRVTDTDKIRVHVPLHFIGEDVAPGVKLRSGIVNHLMKHVDVTCLAKDLPEYIEVDVSPLEAGESVHLSDLKLPAGVEIQGVVAGSEHDLPVVSIVLPRAALEVEEAAAAAPEEAAATPEQGGGQAAG